MWYEVLLIAIGAVIGIFASIATTIANRALDYHGKVKLYAKVVYSKAVEGHTWGFHVSSGAVSGTFFDIPLWLEIQNTSNAVRVLRDVNLILYRKNEPVAEMTQLNKFSSSKHGEEQFANSGAYSFVSQPRSISKYDCQFALKKDETDSPVFDEVRLRYFDENDKPHLYEFEKVDGNWNLGELPREGYWKLLKGRAK